MQVISDMTGAIQINGKTHHCVMYFLCLQQCDGEMDRWSFGTERKMLDSQRGSKLSWWLDIFLSQKLFMGGR